MQRTFCLILAAVAAAASAVAAPQVAVTRSTAGLSQPSGGSRGADSFVLANFGDAPANITITQKGSFFSVSPSAFTLAAGASRSVDIRSETDSGGVFDGSVTVLVAGVTQSVSVPIRLFVQQPPPANFTPLDGIPLGASVGIRAATTQVVVSGPPSQSHGGGVTFANFGVSGSSAILGAEAPWIQPQSGVLQIAPKSNNNASFAVDPSMRPDSAGPLGASVSSMSLLYLTGAPPGSGSPATARAGVQVFDITKPAIIPQQPPPIGSTGAAQVLPPNAALFLAGLSDIGFSNVFFSNRTTAGDRPDLRVFYAAANAANVTPLLANLGLLAPGVNAWFPDALATLFNLRSQQGMLQVRSNRIDRVAASATIGVGVRDDGRDRYITALPLLRSVNSVASGDRLIFSGVEKTTGVHTDVAVIESAGFGGAYTIDFFDAAGAPLAPSRSGAVLPFGFVNLADTVPNGARSARLSNASGGGTARIIGYAAVIDERTRDSWIIVDSSRVAGSGGQFRVPFPMLNAGTATQLDLYVTNGSASPVTVSFGARSGAGRRRAVRNEISADADPQSFPLGPQETRRVQVAPGGDGYVQINGPTGAISANARLVSSDPAVTGTFGTGLPALPLTSAGGIGVVKRFSRQTDDTNFSPAGLLLLESAGKPATVRVTIRFSFPAGSTVSGQLTVPKTYELAANQLLAIPQITRAILGAQRDTLGRIFNLAIDVEVIGGEGKVLAYLQTTEASGDITMEMD